MAMHLSRDIEYGGAYRSTLTGNFDLYLPFIEKGIQLLNNDGRLGYIAPSVWTYNQYGAGLRGLLEERQLLWGWIDFGAYQIFEEATVYTALQFFSKNPNDHVSVVQARNGVVAENPWEADGINLSYDQLPFSDRWLLVTGPERELIDKLDQSGLRLEDTQLTRKIFVGIQTSADHIFHLKKLGTNRYEKRPSKDENESRIVELEDQIMKPLVSGIDAKRYQIPNPESYLLFPYQIVNSCATLLPAATMQNEFPLAWAYLREYETELRSRESKKFDDNQWWRFGRNQNVGIQEVQKLIVPRLVAHIGSSVDSNGEFYLDNVDVGGIIPARNVSPYYLAAVLNASSTDFVFRKISKPFRGEFRSANKQFIAPLPIPNTTKRDKLTLATDAECLQNLYSDRHDVLSQIALRLDSIRAQSCPDNWLFPDLPGVSELIKRAPKSLIDSRRHDWAKRRLAKELEMRHAALEDHLIAGAQLFADLHNGELRFLINETPVISGIFPPSEQAQFILAQWRVLASCLVVTNKLTGKMLATKLKKICMNTDAHIMTDIITRQEIVSNFDVEIAQLEARINQMIYRSYDLTEEEIQMIEMKE